MVAAHGLSFTAAAPQSPEAVLSPGEAAGECWIGLLPLESPILGFLHPLPVYGRAPGILTQNQGLVPSGCVWAGCGGGVCTV